MRRFLKDNWLTLSLFAALAAIFLRGIAAASASSGEEARLAAERSLRRAAVACYALEGSYPPSYEYMAQNYGVRIDEGRFAVYYTVFASNLMPDITVLERGEGK